jgi:hypothetical protein
MSASDKVECAVKPQQKVECFVHIRLKKEIKTEKTTDGSTMLILPAQNITIEDSRVLSTLFPNLRHAVEELLVKEALFNAIEP